MLVAPSGGRGREELSGRCNLIVAESTSVVYMNCAVGLKWAPPACLGLSPRPFRASPPFACCSCRRRRAGRGASRWQCFHCHPCFHTLGAACGNSRTCPCTCSCSRGKPRAPWERGKRNKYLESIALLSIFSIIPHHLKWLRTFWMKMADWLYVPLRVVSMGYAVPGSCPLFLKPGA